MRAQLALTDASIRQHTSAYVSSINSMRAELALTDASTAPVYIYVHIYASTYIYSSMRTHTQQYGDTYIRVFVLYGS